MYGVQHVAQKSTTKMNVQMMGNCLAIGESSLFSVAFKNEWCEICKQWGHTLQTCALLGKYQKTEHTPFYVLYKSMGHDIQGC